MDPQGVVPCWRRGRVSRPVPARRPNSPTSSRPGSPTPTRHVRRRCGRGSGTTRTPRRSWPSSRSEPDDATLQQALADYLATHQVDQDPGVAGAVDQLQVQLARIEGGISSISTGAVIGNTLTADHGAIAAVNITGGAHASYTPPAGGDGDPR